MVWVVSVVQDYGYSVVVKVFDNKDLLNNHLSELRRIYNTVRSDLYEFSIVEEGSISQSIKVEEIPIN